VKPITLKQYLQKRYDNGADLHPSIKISRTSTFVDELIRKKAVENYIRQKSKLKQFPLLFFTEGPIRQTRKHEHRVVAGKAITQNVSDLLPNVNEDTSIELKGVVTQKSPGSVTVEFFK